VNKGDLFNSKFKERLKQDKWFAALQFKKQKLLAKYAQSRMFQKETLSSLIETHSVNQNFAKSVKIGHIASTLEAMSFGNHESDLNLVWEIFERVQKDMSDGLTPGMSLENFVIASQKIDPAMYGLMGMLNAQNFNSERLWSIEGFCGGSAINYFLGFLLQSLYLKSVALRTQGLQMNDGQFKEFSDGVEEIKSKQYSSCSCKFLIIIYRFTVNI
jgi:hypothetical protein